MRHWTATERARQSELIRNWKPWEHSTGATTLKGKECSSKNAKKHGMYSRETRALQRLLTEHQQQVRDLSINEFCTS